jgi:hypothetical protein
MIFRIRGNLQSQFEDQDHMNWQQVTAINAGAIVASNLKLAKLQTVKD